MTGAEVIVECLRAEQVSLIFGYPGATIVPFYDALRDSGIRHILTRTEQGAGHAASGWARQSGRPGVCVATSGPGATNLFTALATAYSDSIPLVAITGQVATSQLGRDVFQEVDTTGAAEPFTKYTYLVKSADDLCRVFKEAFHIASTGRPGPVLIDVPVDVQLQTTDFVYPDCVGIRGYKPRTNGHTLQVRRVAQAIAASKRPLICCGGGVFLSHAEDIVRHFCEDCSLPAVTTMMGLSLFVPEHPLYFGMLGRGSEIANTAIRESDLLVLIGARVNDRAITSPTELEHHATIVHIDIDTAEIGKNVGTTIPLVGDAARVITQLAEQKPCGDWKEWLNRLNRLREEEGIKALPNHKRDGVDPNHLVQSLSRQLPSKSVYVADVGQNQLWSARNYCAHGRFMTTGGMGTMGYSIPAAIGAKLACPKRIVVAVLGDGAFQMSMNELATMLQHKAAIKIVVLQNDALGLVREIQQNDFKGREFAVELSGGPDINLIAEAYGIPHAALSDDTGIDKAIAAMLTDDEPYLLVCTIDPREVTA